MSSSEMNANELVYRIYFSAPTERVFEALYRPEDTRRYWGAELTTDWQAGSPITWFYAGVTLHDPESVVVEFDPPRRLSYTWHTTTPEFAQAQGMTEDMQRRLAAERRSTITFALEPFEDLTKLTLTQTGFDQGSAKLASLTQSWPRIMSQLKTFLELGDR